MAASKKFKEEAKALKIPNYWRYGEKKLKELIAAKQPKNKPAPKNTPAKSKAPNPATKAPAKPKSAVIAKPKPEPTKPKDNKSQILNHITACNKLIAEERKLISGSKSVHHYSMLDRSLIALKDVTTYLAKIQ